MVLSASLQPFALQKQELTLHFFIRYHKRIDPECYLTGEHLRERYHTQRMSDLRLGAHMGSAECLEAVRLSVQWRQSAYSYVKRLKKFRRHKGGGCLSLFVYPCISLDKPWAFQEFEAHEGYKDVSPMLRLPLPQEIFLLLISIRISVRPEGLCQWKIPVTMSGIESATSTNCAISCTRRAVG
jgi:hypothetical protein